MAVTSEGAWTAVRVSYDNDTVLERFMFLVNAPALFNAVATAIELRIFELLAAEGSADFDTVHQFTGVPRHQLRVLLHAVCTTGLVTKEDGRYANSPVAADMLAPDAEDSWAHIVLGWKEVYYPAFAHLTSAVRTGTNTALQQHSGDEPTLYGRLSHDADLETVFHRAMSAFTLRSLDALVERPEFASVRHLLDIGGGDGITSARLVERHADLRATIFDLPSVSQLADRRMTGNSSASDRVALCHGDIFTDEFPGEADAVLFSHVLEIFSEPQIRTLLKKAYQSLPAGGRVFIYGFNVDDEETSGMFSARLGLYFNVLASGQGMAYPAKDYETWLTETGFGDVKTVAGMPYEHGLSTGVK